MGSTIASSVQWLVVPGIIASLFVIALRFAIHSSKRDLETSVSTRAGFWAGLVIFVIYVVSQADTLQNPSLNLSRLPSFQFIPTVAGLICGFGVIFLARMLIGTRFSGIVTLILVAASTSALFSYFFIEQLRVVAVYASLGFALGVLVYAIAFPRSIQDMFD